MGTIGSICCSDDNKSRKEKTSDVPEPRQPVVPQATQPKKQQQEKKT
jgi:hypothetical protein